MGREAVWDAASPRLVAQYLQYLQLLRALQSETWSRPGLDLEVDLASWLHEVPTDDGIPLDHVPLRETARVDAVAVASAAYAGIAVHHDDAWRTPPP